MMINQNIAPDVASIKAHLHHITRRWGELDEPCLLEVVHLSADDRAKVVQTSHYTADADGIELATSDIANFNKNKVNCYATVNPVSATNRPPAHKRASAEHILASFFHFADADDAQAAENIRNFVGPKPTFYVMTGTVPSQRPHVYWEIEDPTRNLDAWSRTQASIAATLKTDKVIDPPRIMRVAGTINWPKPQKQAKGYQVELTSLVIHNEDNRPPVTSENMSRAFKDAPQGDADGFPIDTGNFEGLDRERTAIQAMSGQEWNNAVLRLVGSYVRKGLSDTEIHALTDPLTLGGYTVQDTRAEVQDMIDRTRTNPKFDGVGQDQQPEPVEATPATIADFQIDDSDSFLADLQPLEYLIEGVIPTGVVYSLTGYTGHGKTTLALQFALSIAEGEDFCGRETTKGSVLVLAGENPYNLKWQYAAALAARGLQRADVHFVQGHFSLDQWTDVLKAKLESMPDVKLIIIDSLQAFFEGDSDNDNTQMVEMARKLRRVGEISSRPAMMIIAHPAGKTPAKDMLVPRGGGGFLNEIDGNLTIWSGDAMQQTLHHSQKFRGAGFEPMEWVMQSHEFEHLTDAKGKPLKLPVSRPEMIIERANRESANDRILVRYVQTVADGQPLSVRELSAQESVSRYRAEQTVNTARDEKLIRRYAKTYTITDGGRDFLEANNAGI